MSQIIVTGGTGSIGQHLCRVLISKGYDVGILSRSSNKKDSEIPVYYWDPDKKEIDQEAINNCEHIIHLAGVNIGEKRWTKKRKEQISGSRIQSANLIFNNLDTQNTRLKTFISASAIGYYGSVTSDRIFKETDLPAIDFLGRVCNSWEQSADQFREAGARVVKIRTGIVLTKKGGVLSKFSIPAKLGFGSAIGSGSQFLPWIHINDLCNLYAYAIENPDIKGAYNAVAPEHITNKEFARKVSKAQSKPFWFPKIPAILLKMLYGEMSEMILNGSRVSSEKITGSGYKFEFPNIDDALASLLKK